MISANENSANQNWPHSHSYPLEVFRNYDQACFAFISPMSWSGKLGAGQWGVGEKKAREWPEHHLQVMRQYHQENNARLLVTMGRSRKGEGQLSHKDLILETVSFVVFMANRSLIAWTLSWGQLFSPLLCTPLTPYVKMFHGGFPGVPGFKILGL